MNSNKQNLINKIKYRSQYRGTKEMDLYVGSFVNSIINDLSFNELENLNILVNLNDEEISKISKGFNKYNIDRKIVNLLVNYKLK
tara:strand:- start:3161 stop:3415 length:255 start_codon:yes stop_codon:yes gene_type:complete